MYGNQAEPATGLVVNVVDIDDAVRECVVPVFSRRIKEFFQKGEHVSLFETVRLLQSARQKLLDKFGKAILSDISLKLNPFRKIAIDCEDYKMIYFSEKFEFAATHKLWNDEFSRERNFEIFGKCAK